MDDQYKGIGKFITAGVLSLLAVVAGGMAGCPTYHVWSSQKAGEAELAQATANRQIKIQEAAAVEESAKHLARAEVERARGVAEANHIIGESLKGNESYLRYLWIQNLNNDKGKEVIYVPTETNLPILEATRLAPRPPEK